MTSHATILVLATLTLLGAGCAKREQPPAAPSPFQQPTAAPSPDATMPTAPPTAADAMPTSPPPDAIAPTQRIATPAPTPRTVSVTARQWTFEPLVIRLQRGERAVLAITSTDVAHGILIPALNVNARLEPGATVRVEVTPTIAGTFPMICNVWCGAGHPSMRGTIVVE